MREHTLRQRHQWIAWAAAGWSLLFAAFHLAWAAGWYIGLDPARARVAFAKPAFLAYDLVVAAMCIVAVPVFLALGLSWGERVPRRLLVCVAWAGTLLLGARAVGSAAQGGYELVTGRFTLDRLGIWELWFYVGAALFAVNLQLFRREFSGEPQPN